MLDASPRRIKHMVAFNYRFVPAIRQARNLIESGRWDASITSAPCICKNGSCALRHPMIWRLEKKAAGSGALGDLGAHIIDLGRFLVAK